MKTTYQVRVYALTLITIVLATITRVRCAIEDLLVLLPGRPPARPGSRSRVDRLPVGTRDTRLTTD
ncbi:hypothetical protein ACIQ8G_26470 [Streptomyces sp. NPDC094154]|uniref:hypothetical protein n=1 Tax=Streptomyces sp. NPDC094154 TaxID=3366059 RepID=UPI0038305F77